MTKTLTSNTMSPVAERLEDYTSRFWGENDSKGFWAFLKEERERNLAHERTKDFVGKILRH